MKAKRTRRDQAFTLIELMVVLVILAILASVASAYYFGQADKAKVITTKTQIKELENAVRFYYLDYGKYPNSLEELLHQTKGKTAKYLDADSVPKDSWQNEFIYRSPGSGDNPFEIISLGADGMQGGTGYDADIANTKITAE